MAYMCADSGNLMEIAQQVIKQKQQREQQQQNHHQQQQHLLGINPLSFHPWNNAPSLGYGLPAADFSDLFQFGPGPDKSEPGFQFPYLDHHCTGLRFSDFAGDAAGTCAPAEFGLDEWMDSLMGGGDSTDGSNLPSACDAWHNNGDFGLYASMPITTFAVRLSPPSDLNQVIFSSSDCQLSLKPRQAQVPTTWTSPPSSSPPTLVKDPPNSPPPPPAATTTTTTTILRTDDTVRGCSSSLTEPEPTPPLLKALIECARLAEIEPDHAMKSLIQLKKSVSQHGDPTERVAFYFSEALGGRFSLETKEKNLAMLETTSEEFTLYYKALNDACPYSKFAHLTANQAILEATGGATKIHIVDFGIVQGVQWAALLQAFATRSTGKPTSIRITGIPAMTLGPSPGSLLWATGNRLSEFAKLLELDFEFKPILTPIHELDESSFGVELDEALAVNFMLQLFNLLDEPPSAVQTAL